MSIRKLAPIVLVLVAACSEMPTASEPHHLRSYRVGIDAPIASDVVSVAGDAWLIVPGEARSVKLFELENPDVEATRLLYRAQLSSERLQGKVYLEMWVRLPGRGMFFSRGIEQPVTGTTAWVEREVAFFLKPGERPDLVQLNVVFEDPAGRVSIKGVKLYEIELPAGSG
ncbi:MAG: hypothetical protein GY725_15605 [bacterium]|nr:hypothetical protein [bacterium]